MKKRTPKTGERLVFTGTSLSAEVIGQLDDGYALLFSTTGKMEDVSVRKLTHSLWEELRAGSLVTFYGEKIKAKAKKGTKPPWAK